MTGIALLRIASLPFETLSALHGEECFRTLAALLDEDRVLAQESESLGEALFSAAGAATQDRESAQPRFSALALRRDVHNERRIDRKALEKARLLLGTALCERVEAHARRREHRERQLSAFEASFEEALLRGRRALLRIAQDPLVTHGIYLASRSLPSKVAGLARVHAGRFTHDERHTLAKLAAYVVRFAAKTSPNGVFCAVGLVPFAGERAALRGTATIAGVDVLLSLSEVRKVSACLAIGPDAEPAIVPRPNPTLRLRDGTFRYWKPASPRNESDREVHAQGKDQPMLRLFLDEAGRGIHDVAALLRAVAETSGRTVEELRPFYALLVERGILIGEIEIPYSSRRRFRDLAQKARERGSAAPWIATIERVEQEVDALPALDPASRTVAMERIVHTVEGLPRNRPFKPDELFRVDAASALTLELPERVLTDLAPPIRTFARLLAAIYPEAQNRRVLERRFLKLHAADTDVEFLDLYGSLVEAEEEEGDARPLEFAAPSGDAPPGSQAARALDAQRRLWAWLAQRARAAPSGGCVEIDEASLDEVLGETREPRWAAGVLFQIAATTPAEIEAGRYQLVLNALFNGIGLALARFAHLLGAGRSDAQNPVVAELSRAWTAMEREGAVIAELTFNHEARTANAGLRPILFAHEIELPGDTTSPGVAAIPLADLVLRYDSASGRLVLRSRSRGVEVIPVVSSGVSPSGIVSELIHIGRQGWQTIGYLPGFEEPGIVRWPRFTCGKVVLFRARWVLRGVDLPAGAGGAASAPDARFFLETARWRRNHGLPRHVFVHTQAEPKPFYVDLESPALVDLLRRALVTSASATSESVLFVTEMLPAPDQLWVRDERGGFATEFLVQMGASS